MDKPESPIEESPIEGSEFIAMQVTGLTMDPFTNMPIIILKDLEEKTALPIWVGLVEASAIATELEKIQLSRPMTHDLLKNILTSLKISTERVEIYNLIDNTFYSQIQLKQGDSEIHVDARPSDAIALAMRLNAPIYVAKHVIEKSRRIDLSKTVGEGGTEQKWVEILENLTPEDFGKYKM